MKSRAIPATESATQASWPQAKQAQDAESLLGGKACQESQKVGECVLAIALPLTLAPTLNVYASQKPWQRAKLRAALDAEISPVVTARLREIGKSLYANGDRRRIIVTRFSSREPDELACDCIGAKALIDRLVIAGILAGDSRKHLEREARWVACKAGAGRLVVQVLAL